MPKLCLILLLVALGEVGPASAQLSSPQDPFVVTDIVRPDFWDTDGTVNAVVATNGRVYVGGSFAYVGPKRRNLAAFDLYTGEADGEFPKVFGPGIHAIIEDGNGGWFVGGKFTRVGELPRTNLVHILSDNTVDPNFILNPDDAVRALALDGTTLFIGGGFTSIGGQVRHRIAAFDLSNHVLSAWAPQANDTVSVLRASASVLYVGGYFTQIGGSSRGRIAALDSLSGVALPWAPEADGAVLTLDLLDQRLFVGGFFNQIGGQLRNGLALLDIGDTNALPWNPTPLGGKVAALRASCDTVYVGGYFTNIAGAHRHRVAALDARSGQALPWNPDLDRYYSANLDSYVLTLELSGQAVYLGGEFITASGLRRDMVAVDATTGQPLPWNPMANGGVTALAVAGRKVLAGFLASPGGVERQNLAAFDQATGTVLDWNPSANGAVEALVAAGNSVYAGGSFTTVGGLTRNRLVAIDATSGQIDPNWSPNVNSNVFALALDGNRLYAGGNFTSLGGSVARHRLGALDVTTGSVITNWAANANGTVYSLTVAGPRLYAGGAFSVVKGFFRTNLVALDKASSAVIETWYPDANQTVHTIVVVGNTVFVGGSFDLIGGQDRKHLAALDVTSGGVMAWDPDAESDVRALAWSGTALYLGGTFGAVSGQERFGCAAVDLQGQLLPWNPGASAANGVHAFGLSENTLYAGGTRELQFKSSPALHSLAAFPQVGAPTLVHELADQSAFAGQAIEFQVSAAGTAPLRYQWSFNDTTLAGETNATLLLPNVQSAQAGIYRVVVSNVLGSITAAASLTVLQPIAIAGQPAAQTVPPGATVTLTVTATGSPPPLYQWRRNGVNIPGAVFPSLTLSNVTSADGGTYHVLVANRLGVNNSDFAEVVVNAPPLPFHDDFSLRGTIGGASGVGSGHNLTATVEMDEKHAGKRGGKSVWLSWTAPANGVATFTTRGSTFDTLLAIYTGSAQTNLDLVASDEDRGGFLTSQASFNAEAAREYLIAVDGLAGAAGQIVLTWLLESNVSAFPRIISQPLSVAVGRGETATFAVEAVSMTPVTYQWFLGCQEIAGATNATLVISNVQTRDVGAYRVVIFNNSTHPAESLPAALEIGPSRSILSFDKLEDVLAGSGGGGSAPLLLTIGSIVTQTFDSSGYRTGLREPNLCAPFGGASGWLIFQPVESGQILVDTMGSSFNTVLAVYYDTPRILTDPNAAFVACDDNGAPDQVRSRLIFPGVAGTSYLALVDGVGGGKGSAVVNWEVGTLPNVVAATSNVTARAGSLVALNSGITSRTLNTTYRWYLNEIEIPGRTGLQLMITNLQALHSGTYRVVASNFVGMVTNVAATLAIAPAWRFVDWAQTTEGDFRFCIVGPPGVDFALQTSTNLTAWTALFTNRSTAEPFPYIETNRWRFPRRLYRVLEK